MLDIAEQTGEQLLLYRSTSTLMDQEGNPIKTIKKPKDGSMMEILLTSENPDDSILDDVIRIGA